MGHPNCEGSAVGHEEARLWFALDHFEGLEGPGVVAAGVAGKVDDFDFGVSFVFVGAVVVGAFDQLIVLRVVVGLGAEFVIDHEVAGVLLRHA